MKRVLYLCFGEPDLMKKIFSVLTLCISILGEANIAHAVDGTLHGVYTYSYIEGHQLYWDKGYKNPTSCANANQMTIRGDDLNGKAMISMSYIAFTTGMNLNCVPKAGCNGINNNAEANYCFLTK